IEETTSDYDKEKLQERLAKLAGGVAVVQVGAATETEMKDKKARVEDAPHATRAAVEEGIVPGGGVACLRARKALGKMKGSGDEERGSRGQPPAHHRSDGRGKTEEEDQGGAGRWRGDGRHGWHGWDGRNGGYGLRRRRCRGLRILVVAGCFRGARPRGRASRVSGAKMRENEAISRGFESLPRPL